MPQERVTSEPGYVDYSPFDVQEDIRSEPAMSADEAAALLGIESMPRPSVSMASKLPVEDDDPLAFLHNLAATQDPVNVPMPYATDYTQLPESGTMGAQSALSWLEELA